VVLAWCLECWAHECAPDDLPVYRVLTGPDDEAFCRWVSEAIALGYRLHGEPRGDVQRQGRDRRAGAGVATGLR